MVVCVCALDLYAGVSIYVCFCVSLNFIQVSTLQATAAAASNVSVVNPVVEIQPSSVARDESVDSLVISAQNTQRSPHQLSEPQSIKQGVCCM